MKSLSRFELHYKLFECPAGPLNTDRFLPALHGAVWRHFNLHYSKVSLTYTDPKSGTVYNLY
jgi:hypothetical protein